jgi:uncharacterized membrane protein
MLKTIKSLLPLTLILFSFVFFGFIFMASDEYCDVVGLNYYGEVTTDGNYNVKEEITFKMSSDVPWRELYREVTIPKTSKYKESKFSDFKVALLKDGKTIPYVEVTDSLEFEQRTENTYGYNSTDSELVWFINEKKGTFVYEISYSVSNVLFEYNDSLELFTSIWDSSKLEKIKHLNVNISLPEGIALNTTDTNMYIYGQVNRIKRQDSTNTYSFKLDNSSRLGLSYVRIQLTIAKANSDIFNLASTSKHNTTILPDILAKNQSFDNSLNNDKIANNIFSGVYIVLGLVSLSTLLFALLSIKKHNIPTPSTEYSYFRDIPSDLNPYFASYLINSDIKKPLMEGTVPALILSLLKTKSIELQRVDVNKKWEGKNINLVLLSDDITNLDAYQKEFFTSLILPAFKTKAAKDNIISFSEYRSFLKSHFVITREVVDTLATTAQKELVEKNYVQSSNYLSLSSFLTNTGYLYYLFGLLSIMGAGILTYLNKGPIIHNLVFIVSAVIILVSAFFISIASKSIFYTQTGIDELAKWKALKKFMGELTLLNEYGLERLQIWQDYLLYATAFGVSKPLQKYLELNITKLTSTSYYGNDPFACLYINHLFITSFDSKSINTSPSSGSSGGFGGGGFGGGGGGGRH